MAETSDATSPRTTKGSTAEIISVQETTLSRFDTRKVSRTIITSKEEKKKSGIHQPPRTNFYALESGHASNYASQTPAILFWDSIPRLCRRTSSAAARASSGASQEERLYCGVL